MKQLVGLGDYTFECDEGEPIIEKFKDKAQNFVTHKETHTTRFNTLTKLQSARINSVFNCIDLDGSGHATVEDLHVLFEVQRLFGGCLLPHVMHFWFCVVGIGLEALSRGYAFRTRGGR
jgi:hypothetical protein